MCESNFDLIISKDVGTPTFSRVYETGMFQVFMKLIYWHSFKKNLCNQTYYNKIITVLKHAFKA